MKKPKTVKDIMVSISRYPHVPHWFPLGKAVEVVRVSLLGTKVYPDPFEELSDKNR